MSKDKNKELELIEDTDDDGQVGVEETYAVILDKLGISTKEMSIESIRQLIHEYEQEGLVKGAQVIDFKTGKSKQTYQKNKSSGRVYQVKDTSSEPVTEAEFARLKKEEDYKARSDKGDQPAPEQPFNPKPSGPSR